MCVQVDVVDVCVRTGVVVDVFTRKVLDCKVGGRGLYLTEVSVLAVRTANLWWVQRDTFRTRGYADLWWVNH